MRKALDRVFLPSSFRSSLPLHHINRPTFSSTRSPVPYSYLNITPQLSLPRVAVQSTYCIPSYPAVMASNNKAPDAAAPQTQFTETTFEAEHRQQANFAEIESQMPSRSPKVDVSFADKFTSMCLPLQLQLGH